MNIIQEEIGKKEWQNDEHAPGQIRVNAVLSNLEKFYEIYDIKSGDGMYIEPSKRIHIWFE